MNYKIFTRESEKKEEEEKQEDRIKRKKEL